MVDVLHEIGKELLFVLSDQPLVNADEVVLVLLASNDLLLQHIRSSQQLGISKEVPKSMELYDYVSEVFPLWDHDVADKVVEVVLHKARHSQGLHSIEGFFLNG